ncbi:hypothetical protein [Microcystis phage MaeS]|nr:hypothetical protein [Microcystis phage MaeS]
MTDKVQRASDNEKIKADLLDEKTIRTIMKRFLGSKVADPEVTKYFKIINGLHYAATNLGSAVLLYFKNKHDGTFNKGTGRTFYRKPLPKDVNEDYDLIPEYETILEGKKKIQRATGGTLEYPDVEGMFAKYNIKDFQEIVISADDLLDFIAVHEAMVAASKIGGAYNTAEFNLYVTNFTIEMYDSPLNFIWGCDIAEDIPVENLVQGYRYDFSLMVDVLKSLKDLKLETVSMYVKKENPILFVGETIEYKFQFALQRKLTK